MPPPLRDADGALRPLTPTRCRPPAPRSAAGARARRRASSAAPTPASARAKVHGDGVWRAVGELRRRRPARGGAGFAHVVRRRRARPGDGHRPSPAAGTPRTCWSSTATYVRTRRRWAGRGRAGARGRGHRVVSERPATRPSTCRRPPRRSGRRPRAKQLRSPRLAAAAHAGRVADRSRRRPELARRARRCVEGKLIRASACAPRSWAPTSSSTSGSAAGTNDRRPLDRRRRRRPQPWSSTCRSTPRRQRRRATAALRHHTRPDVPHERCRAGSSGDLQFQPPDDERVQGPLVPPVASPGDASWSAWASQRWPSSARPVRAAEEPCHDVPSAAAYRQRPTVARVSLAAGRDRAHCYVVVLATRAPRVADMAPAPTPGPTGGAGRPSPRPWRWSLLARHVGAGPEHGDRVVVFAVLVARCWRRCTTRRSWPTRWASRSGRCCWPWR